MIRISRKLSFFKRNYNSIFGSFWLLLAISYYSGGSDSSDRSTSMLLFSIGYLIISLLYFFSAYKHKGKNSEYIEWDESRLYINRI